MAKYTVVLTGGIASGKTFVSNYLSGLNAHVIDTDVIARALLQVNGNQYSREALTQVREYFGDAVFSNDTLDRQKLREKVFSDDLAKVHLESITHPLILKEVSAQLNAVDQGYNLVVVPLLHQNSPYLQMADEVLVVEVDPKVQLKRVMARDQITEELALRIIHSQVSNEVRRSLADTIIINTNEMHTQNVLKQLDKKYSLAPF